MPATRLFSTEVNRQQVRASVHDSKAEVDSVRWPPRVHGASKVHIDEGAELIYRRAFVLFSVPDGVCTQKVKMVHDPISADVREFIQRHIDSVAQLEALLLLRSNPDVAWDVATTARRLYTSEQEISEALDLLCADGLVGREEGRFRFQCSSELRQKIDGLASAYSRQLIPITNLIHAKPRRIRQFADAFKFRKYR